MTESWIERRGRRWRDWLRSLRDAETETDPAVRNEWSGMFSFTPSS